MAWARAYRAEPSAGAIVIREPYEFEGAPGSAIATLADPDDNYFQLTSPMDMGGESPP